MSKDLERLEIINADEVVVLCHYHPAGMSLYPHEVSRFNRVLGESIPSIKERNINGEQYQVFFPTNEIRIKGDFIPYEGARKRKVENGTGYHYSYNAGYKNSLFYLKRLHKVIDAQIKELRVIKKCEIIWGDLDKYINTSISDYTPFKKSIGFEELKMDEERSNKIDHIFNVKQKKRMEEFE